MCATSRETNFGKEPKVHELSATPLVDAVSLRGGVVCEEKMGGRCC